MIFIKESEAPSEVIGPPYKRIIRHLSAPWTTGSKNVWIGTSSVDPGYTSNEHFHDGQEKIFYCVSGKGKIKVDSEIADMEPGDWFMCLLGVSTSLLMMVTWFLKFLR